MHRTTNWILMLAMLASIFALYAIKDGTRRLEARVQAQERVLERAENDVSVLTAERAHLARPQRLEPLARKLGMAPVASSQYLRVDLAVPSPRRVEDAPSARRGGETVAVPSPIVGEGEGGGDGRTSAVGTPPTPNPSPQGGGEHRATLRRAPPPAR